MKFMGSKRAMLANGLGEIVRSESKQAERFVDLFVGSGAVAWYVAEATATKVLAVDLQEFATVLEPLSIPWRERAEADEGAAEVEEGEVQVVGTLVADREASVATEPGEGPLKHPATIPLRR